MIAVAGVIISGAVFLLLRGLTEDSPHGQLQRSRLGLDKPPSAYDLYKDDPKIKAEVQKCLNKEGEDMREFFKNLPKTQPELFTRDNDTGLYSWRDNNQSNYTLPKINVPTSKASAGYYMHDLSKEEEKYKS